MKLIINDQICYARMSPDDEPPKSQLINELDVNQYPKCFIKFETFYEKKKINHVYTSFLTWNECFNKKTKISIYKAKTYRSYIYEIIREGLLVKPYLDVEHKYNTLEQMNENKLIFLNKVINDIIKLFEKEYSQIIVKNDILISDGSRKIIKRESNEEYYKMSFHIIISPKNANLVYKTNVKYSESSAYHFYSSLLKYDEDYYKDILDGHVYNRDGAFRCLGSYKDKDDDVKLCQIDTTTYKPIKKYDEYTYLRFAITYQDPENETIILRTPMLEQTKTQRKYIANTEIKTTDYITNELIYRIKKGISCGLYKKNEFGYETNDYMGCDVNYIGFNKGFFNFRNNSKKCPLSGREHHKTQNVYIVEQSDGFLMKCFSPHCSNYFIKLGHISDDESYKINCVIIDVRYNIMEIDIPLDDNILSKYNDARPHIIKWINDNTLKTLCIKASMGTGKTEVVKLICNIPKFKRILWVTSRITLTENINGKFGNDQFKFVSYLDIKGTLFNYDRVICQIDSLERLFETNKIKKYDLIIIDEIESALSHFTSPHLEQKYKTARSIFNLLQNICSVSYKILCLDADYNLRAFKFIEYFGKSLLIHNIYNTQKKKYIMIHDYGYFLDKICTDLNDGLKVCIASMASGLIQGIEDQIKKFNEQNIINKKPIITYNIYYGKTSDYKKSELQDVNEIWSNYKLIMYSPTIESGVDVVIEFDKLYGICYGGDYTTSQRAFLQMCGRLRNIKDENVICFCDKLINFNVSSEMYTFDDIFDAFKYASIKTNKPILEYKFEELEDGTCQKIYDKENISLFDNINILNYVESINKNNKIFLSVLFRLIREKGSDMILCKDITLIDKNDENNSMVHFSEASSEIINETYVELNNKIQEPEDDVVDEEERLTICSTSSGRDLKIDKWTYLYSTLIDDENLLSKQQKGEKMEEEEKIKIERYLYNRQYNVNIYDILQKIKNIDEENDKLNDKVSPGNFVESLSRNKVGGTNFVERKRDKDMMDNNNKIKKELQEEYGRFLNDFMGNKEEQLKNIERHIYNVKQYDDNAFNMKENKYTYLTKILDDLMALFVGGYTEEHYKSLVEGFKFNFVELEKIKKDVTNESLYIKDEKNVRAMMKKEIKRKNDIMDGKNFINTMKLFFSYFGILLTTNKKQIQINKKRGFTYTLQYDPLIIDILDIKYKKKNISEFYPTIIKRNELINDAYLLSDDED